MKKLGVGYVCTNQFVRHALFISLAWCLFCGGAIVFIYQSAQNEIFQEARIMARTSIDKDIAFRHWVAEKGGVYVRPSQSTPPNTFLKVENRDVITTSGQGLTLVNPSYMTRQVFEQEFTSKTSLKSHITSLKPLRPLNRADMWETEALLSFEQGELEFGQAWQFQGEPAFRYMRPLVTESSCLKCHADQGYVVGDIRGGISVIVPLGELVAGQNYQFQIISASLGGIWFVGLLVIVISWRRVFLVASNLQQERDNMRLLFEATPNGMLLFDHAYEVIKSNRAFDEMFSNGLSPCGEAFGDIAKYGVNFTPKDSSRILPCQNCLIHKALHDAFKNKTITLNSECILESEDSLSSQTILFSVAPLHFGKEEGALLVLADISEQKLAEKERELLQNQLHQSQKIEAIGRLAGGVAHDFNNMLSVILGNSHLALQRVDSGSPIKGNLRQIEEAAKHSADLTRQLLGFARKQIIVPQNINLNDSIEEMLKMLRQLVGEDVEIIWESITSNLHILIDPSQLKQILANLVLNARDAIQATGTIIISARTSKITEDYQKEKPWCQNGDYVQLSVSDDGCGMIEEVSQHVFEPFYTTKEDGKGTGLGLATVYGIVKQNNGFINIYSELRQGTTISIYFPGVNNEIMATTDAKDISVHGGETILIVEDEEKLLNLEKKMLEDVGFKVIGSSDPVKALEVANEYEFNIDLLLTDVIMPKLNGKQLSEKFRLIYPEAKILYMSGYPSDIISNRGFVDKETVLIEKPFSSKTLTLKVREVLDM